jgi:hypothetical protein
MLTTKFLDRTRKRWMKWLTKFEYYAGQTWYTAEITDKVIKGDTLQITTVTTDSAALTITKVRIYDNNGDLALEADENITKLATQGVLTVWQFPLYEV